MVVDIIKHERENGIYYTPQILAEHLANPLITSGKIKVLDPAYGEGALLLAAERIHSQKTEVNKTGLSLFGCDTKPVNGLLKHLPKANLRKVNFFDYSIENKFSVILMNPPYVRHHLLDSELIEKIKNRYPETKELSNSADLWAYFTIKAFHHLLPQGSIGAILPWAFLQADYAKPLRQKLANNFGSIKVLALSHKYFEKAQERIVLVWMNDFGRKCDSISIGSAKDTISDISFSSIQLKDWVSDKVHYSGESNIEKLLDTCKVQFKFKEFSVYADVKIGVVTGADKFFICSIAEAKKRKFKRRNLIPILTTSKEFANVLKSGSSKLKQLISISKTTLLTSEVLSKVVIIRSITNVLTHCKETLGILLKLDKFRIHFSPYRVNISPHMLPNSYLIQSTNSIHRIYFKKLTKIEAKWLHVSILSSISQLSLEVNL
jgi:adenine-specific DNA-methyltransferase